MPSGQTKVGYRQELAVRSRKLVELMSDVQRAELRIKLAENVRLTPTNLSLLLALRLFDERARVQRDQKRNSIKNQNCLGS